MEPAVVAAIGAVVGAMVTATGAVIAARASKMRGRPRVTLVACRTRLIDKQRAVFDICLRNSGAVPAVLTEVRFECTKSTSLTARQRPTSFFDDIDSAPRRLSGEGGLVGCSRDSLSYVLPSSQSSVVYLPPPTATEFALTCLRYHVIPAEGLDRATVEIAVSEDAGPARHYAYLLDVFQECGDVKRIRIGSHLLATGWPEFDWNQDKDIASAALDLRSKLQRKARRKIGRQSRGQASKVNDDYLLSQIEAGRVLRQDEACTFRDITHYLEFVGEYLDDQIENAENVARLLQDRKGADSPKRIEGAVAPPDREGVIKYLHAAKTLRDSI